jgi:hypothetical protein
MGITLIIVMGMLAFIINVGLFVKAKINLQNATDAAAFAGAATQARQLTNIAYVNWELRNTYKEWMFKYYVLGQLGLIPYNLKNTAGKGTIDFILPTPPISGFPDFDKYNIPSICIHNNSKTNICPIYALPGIPRFPAIGVAGISEIHEAFVDKLVEEKGKDCSRRSKANFLTALTWAYGSGMADMPEAPLVATNRPGAWPEALELAFRMRNLEMILNRPPVSEITRKNVEQFSGQADEIGLNERPMKAFWSAYRNLGGGVYKDCASQGTADCTPDELSFSLKLTELAPNPYNANPNSVSGFLIPPTFVYPGGSSTTALQKHYVDLQLMPINYATLFSTFVDTSNVNNALGGVQAEATCGISKSALPVPGYILGFNKNPEVLTYYAVKAEAKFIGLFFPISRGPSTEGVKLTAYAAAKPFGGRIGPKLFSFTDNDQTVVARDDVNRRSGSYISGLKIINPDFKPGMPIPSSSDFWVGDLNPVIGGIPGTADKIKFGIPNMIYDFQDESDLVIQTQTAEKVQIINALTFENQPRAQKLGLYHQPQINALKQSLGVVNPGTSMSGDEVLKAIIRARRPTKYDAINYLIPDFRDVTSNGSLVNAAPMVQRLNPIPPTGNPVGYTYKLFAPLLGPNLLYKTNNDIESVINQYMLANDSAVDTYLQALQNVAKGIYNIPSKGDTKEAAKSIHINAGGGDKRPDFLIAAPASDPGCKTDMASKFNHFFRAKFVGCDIVPLQKLMVDFIEAHSSKTGGIDKSLYYLGFYFNDSSSPLTLTPEQLLTAYYPGARQGTSPGDEGIAEHPLKINAPTYSTRRNFYSTKFFHMAKIIDSPPAGSSPTRGRLDYQDQPALREQYKEAPADLNGTVQVRNYLKYDAATGIDNIFYLDF